MPVIADNFHNRPSGAPPKYEPAVQALPSSDGRVLFETPGARVQQGVSSLGRAGYERELDEYSAIVSEERTDAAADDETDAAAADEPELEVAVEADALASAARYGWKPGNNGDADEAEESGSDFFTAARYGWKPGNNGDADSAEEEAPVYVEDFDAADLSSCDCYRDNYLRPAQQAEEGDALEGDCGAAVEAEVSLL